MLVGTATVTARGTEPVDPSRRGGDFYVATTGDLNLATSGDFFMATDNDQERDRALISTVR